MDAALSAPDTSKPSPAPPLGARRAGASGSDAGSPVVAPLDALDKYDLEQQANGHAENSWSSEQLTPWLVNEGLPHDEAERMALKAWKAAQWNQIEAAAKRHHDVRRAWAEIVGGVILLMIGLAVGWLIGLAFVLVFRGVRRLTNSPLFCS